MATANFTSDIALNNSNNYTNDTENYKIDTGHKHSLTYIGNDYDIQDIVMAYWSNSSEYAVANAMQTYVPPLLIVFGTVGNILSYCVLRKSTKQCSVFYYMALYALTNTLNLYVACGLFWISHITHTPYIANVTDWLCKIWKFVFNVMQYTSTWLVVAMAFDRFVYLCIPSKAHSLCTVFTAKVITIFIIVILVVISIHAMWTYELIGNQCTIDTFHRRDFQTVVWPWFAATVHTYLPIILLIVFDIFIIINLILQNMRRYQNRNFSPVQEQLTIVVLVITISFVLLSLPSVILNFTLYLAPVSLFRNPVSNTQIRLAQVICQFLLFILCSINFPLYFVSLPMLPKELEIMVKGLVKRKNVTTNQCGNSTIEVNGKQLRKKDSSRTLECTLITQL